MSAAPVAAGGKSAAERITLPPEVVEEFRSWHDEMVANGQGAVGRRGWREQCVGKACEILFSHTGRVNGSAVARIIGFGSATDVSRDVKTWLDNLSPRQAAWRSADPLLQTAAVQETLSTALAQLLASVRQEATKLATHELQGARDELERERALLRDEMIRVEAAREAALATAAAFERQRDEAVAAQAALDKRLAQQQTQLVRQTAELAGAAQREQDLQLQVERLHERTQAAIAQLNTMAEGYQREISRLEGDQRRHLLELDKARTQAEVVRSDLAEASIKLAQQEADLSRLATQQRQHQGELDEARAAAEEERNKAGDALEKLAAQRAEIRLLTEDRAAAMLRASEASERCAVLAATLANLRKGRELNKSERPVEPRSEPGTRPAKGQ